MDNLGQWWDELSDNWKKQFRYNNGLEIESSIVPDIELLERMKSLKKFSVDEDYPVTDLRPLLTLSNLNELKIRDIDVVDDLSILPQLTNLTVLTITSDTKKVIDISLILPLTLLEQLTIDGKCAYEKLSALIKLKKLEIYGNYISDLSFLTPLQSLTHLDLSVNNTEKLALTPIATCTNMKNMKLRRVQCDSLEALIGMKNLRALELTGSEIKDVSPLANCTNLSRLYLSESEKLKDITPLSALKKLRILHLDDTNVTDLTPVIECPSLAHLNVKFDKIFDPAPLFLTELPRIESFKIRKKSLKPDVIKTLEASGIEVEW